MTTLGVWTRETYDDPHRGWRQFEWFDPGVGSNRPCVIYCAGHGWNSRHPSLFYDDVFGDSLFLNEIYPNRNTNPCVVVSMHQASSRYNAPDTSQPNWVPQSGYLPGDLRNPELGGNDVYRCLSGHESDYRYTPETGASWEERWHLTKKSDIGNQLYDEYARTPAFRSTGARDLQACIQYLRKHAGVYDIDPNKIIVMGASAGGQQAGCAAYSNSGPYIEERSATLGHQRAFSNSSQPQAAILRITPSNFEDFGWTNLLQHLFGWSMATADWGTAVWNTVPDEEKASLSPLGVLKSTENSIKTFFAYANNGYAGDGVDDTIPYTQYHAARNGQDMYQYIVGTLGQTGCVFTEDHPISGQMMNVWEDLVTGQPQRVVLRSGEDELIFTWLTDNFNF
jgi:hypothetical protein